MKFALRGRGFKLYYKSPYKPRNQKMVSGNYCPPRPGGQFDPKDKDYAEWKDFMEYFGSFKNVTGALLETINNSRSSESIW